MLFVKTEDEAQGYLKKIEGTFHDPEDSRMCGGCKEANNAQEIISGQYKTVYRGLERWLNGFNALHAYKRS